MMNAPVGAAAASLTGPRRDLLEPSLTMVHLKYHTVPLERLAARTVRDLTHAGLGASAFGRLEGASLPGSPGISGARLFLTGCIPLTEHARASLPPELGGTNAAFPASPTTSVLAGSAARGASLEGTPRMGPDLAPRSLFGTPGRGETSGGPDALGGAPSSAERRRLCQAVAAALEVAGMARAQATEALEVEGRAREAQRAASGAAAVHAQRRSARQASRATTPSAPTQGATASDLAPDAPALPAVLEGEAGASADGGGGAAGGEDTLPRLLREEVASGVAAELAVAEADDLVAAAASFRVRAGQEALAAEEEVVLLEESLSALSALSAATGRSPRAWAGGPVDMAREQSSLEATAKNMGQKSDAITELLRYPIQYPLIARALLARSGGGAGARPAVLEDFSLLALLPAVLAAKAQAFGLKMLRDAAVRSAGTAGAPGARALRALSVETFDLLASDAIETGEVGVDVSLLDLCLGVLPLTQLGLHFWYKFHSFRPEEASALLKAAQSISFVVNGALDPGPGLVPFLPLWQSALGTDDDVPHEEIYFALVEALHRDPHPSGASFVSIVVSGIPTAWDAFALGRVAAWRADSGGLLGAGRRLPSRADLITLVRQLRGFADACAVTAYAPGSLRPPSMAVRLVQVAPPAGPPTCPRPPAVLRNAPAPGLGHWGRRRPDRTPGLAPHRGQPLALGSPIRVDTMVVPTAVNIIAITPLLAAGWTVRLEGGTGGSSISVPGCPRPIPLRHDASGNIFLEIVPVANLGFTPFDASLAEHRALPRSHFLLDTGAEITIVSPQNMALLREIGTVPLITVTGFTGVAVRPSAAGVFCLYPPRGALARPPPVGGWGGGHGRVHFNAPFHARTYGSATAMVRAVKDADAAMRRLRTSAFPPTKHAHILAERYNCVNADSLRALIVASPIGVADGLLETVVPDTDYSQGYASNIMKAPPIHATRYTLSAAIRDAMPPGHVWWTDVSNARPPDFQGNTYSRLFAEERTSYALTLYAPRKDSATLVAQLDELRVWISQHVPGGHLSVLRCDFASEIVKQCHGDEINTKALTAYYRSGWPKAFSSPWCPARTTARATRRAS